MCVKSTLFFWKTKLFPQVKSKLCVWIVNRFQTLQVDVAIKWYSDGKMEKVQEFVFISLLNKSNLFYYLQLSQQSPAFEREREHLKVLPVLHKKVKENILLLFRVAKCIVQWTRVCALSLPSHYHRPIKIPVAVLPVALWREPFSRSVSGVVIGIKWKERHK